MFSVKKSDIFILLHLSTTSGPQESNSMFFQRKGIPDLWISHTEHLEFQENIPDALHGYPPS